MNLPYKMYVVRPNLKLFLPNLFYSMTQLFRWYPKIEEIGISKMSRSKYGFQIKVLNQWIVQTGVAEEKEYKDVTSHRLGS